MKTLISSTLITLALGAPLAAAGEKSIVETAVAAGSFKTLVAAVTEAGLVDALSGEGPLTVFAPTDDAFAKLPEGTVEALLQPENRDRLVAILTYHVVAGDVRAADVVKLNAAGTLNGQRVDIMVDDDEAVRIDGAKLLSADIGCTNGVIHVIDTVLLPSDNDIVATAAEAGSFGTLITAVKAAGLAETLMSPGPFTVLAPSDAAFEKLPRGTVENLLKPENRDQLVSILTYHVIPGRVYSDEALATRKFATVQSAMVKFAVKDERAMVGDAGLVATDIEASNGVIHVIDTVLMPPKKMANSDGSFGTNVVAAPVKWMPMSNSSSASTTSSCSSSSKSSCGSSNADA